MICDLCGLTGAAQQELDTGAECQEGAVEARGSGVKDGNVTREARKRTCWYIGVRKRQGEEFRDV